MPIPPWTCLIPDTKQDWAWLTLEWEAAWETPVPWALALQQAGKLFRVFPSSHPNTAQLTHNPQVNLCSKNKEIPSFISLGVAFRGLHALFTCSAVEVGKTFRSYTKMLVHQGKRNKAWVKNESFKRLIKLWKKISSLKTYLHVSEDCGSDSSIKKVQKDYYTF